jgi:hypothetical protein
MEGGIMPRRAALAGLAIMAALASCGGDDESDRDAIDAAFGTVQEALVAKDLRGVCAALGARGREQLSSIAHGDPTCAEGLQALLEGFPQGGRARSVANGARMGSVELRAIATVDVDGRSVKVPFVKEGDGWKLDSFYGLSPTPSVAIP